MARGQERAARGLEHAAERVLQRGRQRHLAKALLRERGDLGRLVADERAEHAQAPALARQRALQRLRARRRRGRGSGARHAMGASESRWQPGKYACAKLSSRQLTSSRLSWEPALQHAPLTC